MDTDLQNAIREAISAEQFENAAALWNIYAGRITNALRNGTCTAARVSQMHGLVLWARSSVTCTHAQSQRRIDACLTRLRAVEAYRRP